MATHRGQARGGRRRRGGAGGQNGTTLSLKEYWGPSVQGINEMKLRPKDSKLVKLAALAPLYETYRIVSWVVHFVHSASNESGSYFAGVSYSSDKHPTDAKGVSGLSPSVCKSITSDCNISVPCAKVMGTPWLHYKDPNPGSVMLFTTSATALNIYVTYNVRFNGPTSVAQDAFDEFYTYDKRVWKDAEGRTIYQLGNDGDVYGELELTAGDDTTVDIVWNQLTTTFRTFSQLHRAISTTISVVHFISEAFTAMRLPVLDHEAILHIQRRPFRATAEQWNELRGSEAAAPSRRSTAADSGVTT